MANARFFRFLGFFTAVILFAQGAWALSGDLEGLHKADSASWGPSSSWTGSNLEGWQELDFIVCRAVLGGAPRSNQPVTLVFPKFKGGIPGFQNIYFISNSPNVIVTTNPVLSHPPAPADWSYTLHITITNSSPGYIYFHTRVAAGAHLNVGSSLQLSGEPSLSPLQIHKPDAGPGNPDLAIAKSGPASATPGTVLNYTLSYTNKASGTDNASRVAQISDLLPAQTTYVPGSASGAVTNEGGVLTWDLTNVVVGSSGTFTYQAVVGTNVSFGQTITNSALILSSEDDGNEADNRARVATAIYFNRAPVAGNDAYGTSEDALLCAPAGSGVLTNDSDPDADALSAVLVSDVTGGTLFLTNNGGFCYRPFTNFHGTDSFTYRAVDGALTSGVATVTITVSPANDAPIATNDSSTTPEDTRLIVPAPGVVGNDFDVDGDVLGAVLVEGVSHGLLVLNPDGSFTYTPAADYRGLDSFTYTAGDGEANSGVATVTINVTPVNDAPVATNDVHATVEDIELSVPAASGVLANDFDVDGDALTAVLVAATTNGSLTLSNNGGFRYQPNANHHGVDAFTYQATDGAATSEVAVVMIIVTPVNDRPVANNDAQETDEDTMLVVPPAGVITNDTDLDGDALTAFLVAGPAHGTLGFFADGSFIYRPGTNYHGDDSFTYLVQDGLTSSSPATVLITVRSVNDVPEVANDSFVTAEDVVLDVPASGGVLTNDVDQDADLLTVLLVETTANGSLVLSSNGGFIYTPALDFNGVDHFTYRVTDGQAASEVAVVTITMTPVNDAPVAVGEGFETSEDVTLVVGAPGLLGNDSDVDLDPLTAVLVSGPGHGVLTLNSNGSFSYTPEADYFGPDSFVYAVNDGWADSLNVPVTITVGSVNDAPGFVAGANQRVNYTAGAQTVPGWASGISPGPMNETGQLVQFILSTDNPAIFLVPPTISPNGELTYTPDGVNFGVTRVTVRLQDDGGTASGGLDTSAPQTFTITLNGRVVVNIVNPANGSQFVGSNNITVVAEAIDPDSTVTNVQIFAGTNLVGDFTRAPYYVAWTNVPTGAHSFFAVASDDLGLSGTSSVVNITVSQGIPVVALGPVVLNRQNGLFEQYVRVTNPTPRDFPNGVLVLISNLPPTHYVWNADGTNNGVPYVQSFQSLPSNSDVTLLIRYYVPSPRTASTPILIAQAVPYTIPVVPLPDLGITSPSGLGFQFTAATNRMYYLQYSDSLSEWITLPGLIRGAGTPVPLASSPTVPKRFLRVMLLP